MNEQQQIEMLNQKLSSLEIESRRILNALQWATKVRLILFFGLLFFALISAFLFYQLYMDIKERRIAEVQRIISEQPADFSEPLTRQIMALAHEQGPYVVEAFRKQAQTDSKLYLAAFDTERNTLIANLQDSVESKLAISYAKLLDQQEALMLKEFPQLKDPEKMENVRRNLELVYQKIGNRYYANFLKEELDELANRLDTFPASEPKLSDVPVAEQIAGEFLELVRMMLVQSEHYQVPASSYATSNSAQPATRKPLDPIEAETENDDAPDESIEDIEEKKVDDDKAGDEEKKDEDNDDEDDKEEGDGSEN